MKLYMRAAAFCVMAASIIAHASAAHAALECARHTTPAGLYVTIELNETRYVPIGGYVHIFATVGSGEVAFDATEITYRGEEGNSGTCKREEANYCANPFDDSLELKRLKFKVPQGIEVGDTDTIDVRVLGSSNDGSLWEERGLTATFTPDTEVLASWDLPSVIELPEPVADTSQPNTYKSTVGHMSGIVGDGAQWTMRGTIPEGFTVQIGNQGDVTVPVDSNTALLPEEPYSSEFFVRAYASGEAAKAKTSIPLTATLQCP